jgi:hypothetical protein
MKFNQQDLCRAAFLVASGGILVIGWRNPKLLEAFSASLEPQPQPAADETCEGERNNTPAEVIPWPAEQSFASENEVEESPVAVSITAHESDVTEDLAGTKMLWLIQWPVPEETCEGQTARLAGVLAQKHAEDSLVVEQPTTAESQAQPTKARFVGKVSHGTTSRVRTMSGLRVRAHQHLNATAPVVEAATEEVEVQTNSIEQTDDDFVPEQSATTVPRFRIESTVPFDERSPQDVNRVIGFIENIRSARLEMAHPQTAGI